MRDAIADEFISSARWLAALAARIGPDDWQRPGLGTWDVRSLLGHAARAIVTVGEYLGRPAERVDTPTALAYLVLAGKADPAAIANRGVVAGTDLGDAPAARVAELVDGVSQLVADTEPGVVLSTAAGGMTLEAYLPTRTVELVVHGCDLASAIGADLDPPSEAAASVAHLLTETHLATNRSATLCLALAGRPVGAADLVLWPSS